MNEHEFSAQLRRLLDGFGAYDRRHTAEVFSELPRRRARARSLLVVVVSGLIGAAVVATLLLPGLLRVAQTASPQRPIPAHTTTPAPWATPQPSTLVVPGSGWVSRLDWSGHRLDSFRLPAGPTAYLQVKGSPDGTMVLEEVVRGGMVLVDARDGHVVGTPAHLGQPGLNIIWSDDSRHLCAMSGAASNLELVVAPVDRLKGEGALRSIRVPGMPDAGAAVVDACSFNADRAVISEFQGVGSTQAGVVVVIRLSDGQVLLHHDYPAPAPFVNVTASADGRFLVGSGSEQPVTKSVVVDLTTGDVVAHIDGVGMAFSADDRYLAVTSLSSEAGISGGTGSLLDWRAGHTVWQGPGQLTVMGVQPDGEAIAVQLYMVDSVGKMQDQWLIVRPAGSAISFKDQAVQP
jgi:hypothetical protein